MTLSGIVAQEIDKEGPAMAFVDQGGMGAGVVDRLHQLGYHNVLGIDFGGKPLDSNKYFNKRSEMWCLMRDWLAQGAAIPPDDELKVDLVGPEYGFTGDKGQIALEKKSDMKKRGMSSPDCADGLALTFSAPVSIVGAYGMRQSKAIQKSSLYD